MTKKAKPAQRIKIKGIKLRYFREKQGVTLKQLEEETGVHSGIISKYENGTYSLPKDKAIKLSEALGVSYAHMTEPYEFTRAKWGTAVKPTPKKAKKEKTFVPDSVAPERKKRKKRKTTEELKAMELGSIAIPKDANKTEVLHTKQSDTPVEDVNVSEAVLAEIGKTKFEFNERLAEQATCQTEDSLPEAVSVEIINGIPHISVTGYAEVVFTTQGVASPRVELK